MKYEVIREAMFDDEIGFYETFGVKNENGEKISDVSINKNKVEKFVEYINLEKISFRYIKYEIEEFFNNLDEK